MVMEADPIAGKHTDGKYKFLLSHFNIKSLKNFFCRMQLPLYEYILCEGFHKHSGKCYYTNVVQ